MFNLNPQSSINLMAASLRASETAFTVDYHEDGTDFFLEDIDVVMSFDNNGNLTDIVGNDQ